MIVYGDLASTACVADLLEAVAADWRMAAQLDGFARHDRLMSAFVAASCLVQGLADGEFELWGADDLSAPQAAGLDLLTALARDLLAGTASGPGAAQALAQIPLPSSVTVKTPEGYAFYAVYPETYAMAAAAECWPGPPLVIGLRSIGTGLAAIVAAASGAAGVVTLRPVGPPFARELRVSPGLTARIRAHPGPFAVVDEGPGLSGSSFGCAGDFLERLGVEAERVVFFPSHAGEPGRNTSAAHRGRWSRARRAVRTLDDLLREKPMTQWFADLIGPATQLEDLSAGAWREARPARHTAPIHPQQERRKFRLTCAKGQWLAKFAGLGAIGETKFRRARALHAAGFTAEPVALRYGFLLEAWEADSGPVAPGKPPPGFLDHMAAYLAFRAQSFPAAPDGGAGLDGLCRMAAVNLRKLVDRDTREVLMGRMRQAVPDDLAGRVHVDGRLHAWEWMRRRDGSFCKFDALDHSCGHDLIGCQPIAWDVAGAAAEFGLDRAEVERLGEALAQIAGTPVESANLPFFDVAYAAFQGGLWAMAEQAASPIERTRTAERRRLYQRRLSALAYQAAG